MRGHHNINWLEDGVWIFICCVFFFVGLIVVGLIGRFG